MYQVQKKTLKKLREALIRSIKKKEKRIILW